MSQKLSLLRYIIYTLALYVEMIKNSRIDSSSLKEEKEYETDLSFFPAFPLTYFVNRCHIF